jgi:hypothetical protein
MNSYDRMIIKIMWGLTMRCLFLILQVHSNNASKIRAEYMAFVTPDGALEKWGMEEPANVLPNG